MPSGAPCDPPPTEAPQTPCPPSLSPADLLQVESFMQSTLTHARAACSLIGKTKWGTICSTFSFNPVHNTLGNLLEILTETPYPGPRNATHESIGSHLSSLTLALQWKYIQAHAPPSLLGLDETFSPLHPPCMPPPQPTFSPESWQSIVSGLPPANQDKWEADNEAEPADPTCMCGVSFKTIQALLVHTSNPPDSLVLHAPDLSTLPRMAAAWLLLAHDSWPLLGESHRLPLPGNCAADAAITELIILPLALTSILHAPLEPDTPPLLPPGSTIKWCADCESGRRCFCLEAQAGRRCF